MSNYYLIWNNIHVPVIEDGRTTYILTSNSDCANCWHNGWYLESSHSYS